MARAFAGNGQDRVRIDGGDAGVDHLELVLWIARPQQRLEVTTGAIIRPRISERRRFSENKNPDRLGRLFRRHEYGQRDSRQRRREKPQAELIVFDKIFLPGHRGFLEEARRITITSQAQSQFGSRQQQQRQPHGRHRSEQPFAAGRQRRRSRCTNRGARRWGCGLGVAAALLVILFPSQSAEFRKGPRAGQKNWQSHGMAATALRLTS